MGTSIGLMLRGSRTHTGWRRRGLAVAILLLLWPLELVPPAMLWGAQNRDTAAQRGVDVAAMKKEIQVFEKMLDIKLSQIPNATLAVGRAKGVYLKGYGIVFTLLVNINRVVILTPFGERRIGKQQTLQEKYKRRQEIREILIQSLKEGPGSFRLLAPGEVLVVTAHFEDSNELDDAKRDRTVILRIFKRDLDEYKNKGYEEFRKRVAIDEY